MKGGVRGNIGDCFGVSFVRGRIGGGGDRDRFRVEASESEMDGRDWIQGGSEVEESEGGGWGGTCQPYCRNLPGDILDCFEVTENLSMQVSQTHADAVKTAIKSYRAAVGDGFLLKLPFTSIFEYLQILRMISTSMHNLGAQGMFYLAAAVSDFYVPWESMVEHKIQSASGPLDMRLAPVPKMLSTLRKDWAPNAFCISFKLETDSDILLKKADMALKRYEMDVVVANELLTRNEQVIVVTSSGKITVRKPSESDDVEDKLIDLLIEKHSDYINKPCTEV
ncbi:Phosphopantothenate--cysteine ligase 2 [Acorus calamus]|uniref:Phosphopantothenate--cysteine ligase 2 n=1 Tax=Acorus calamus TaxID=4465 RepID=A0AAV9CQK0_ACOCL|nr:Phosphopantothenate--cysteine ligase 2 [Acorus calamus]